VENRDEDTNFWPKAEIRRQLSRRSKDT